jgi:hypothetical protein
MSNLLQSSIALVKWLRDTGNTGKPRSSRVPRRLLEELEKSIGETEQLRAVDLATDSHCPNCNARLTWCVECEKHITPIH